eukprot:TRINITY_DN23727_c0_g1_i2.p1 TRINITY_DN23727_c0_g1~~TRINITY_DN23727_c0_g1_i2.p1  ORF type:complete len:320 (-),score=73.86 TRINITY_DN23727_c0_g1_i2:281-1240(-)
MCIRDSINAEYMGNNISTLDEVKLLQTLEKLQILDLYGNKVADLDNYRAQIYKLFPKLIILDSEDKDGQFDETTTNLVAQRVNSNLIDKSQLNKLSKAQQEVVRKVSSQNLQPRTQSIKVIKQNSKLGKSTSIKIEEEKKSTQKIELKSKKTSEKIETKETSKQNEQLKEQQAKTETKPKRQTVRGTKIGSKGKTDLTFSKRISQSTRSGLVFPCGRIGRYLKSSFPNFRQSSGSKVYMAAVLEYLAAEIIELAGNYSVQGKKSRIQPIHIKYAIRDDEELSKFLTNIILNEGGNVQSNFQLPILKKKQKETQIEEEKK